MRRKEKTQKVITDYDNRREDWKPKKKKGGQCILQMHKALLEIS
jgi:hypothetical protein